MAEAQAYYYTPTWYARKDKVRARAGRRCEFCRYRVGVHCHHRSYARFGREHLNDLMLVCLACHRAIHGLTRRTLTCAEGSLLAQGDSGMGDGALWQAYLSAARKARKEACCG
jgi:predicted HNH restriction endonuclease